MSQRTKEVLLVARVPWVAALMAWDWLKSRASAAA
jgi:hypothetical protein